MEVRIGVQFASRELEIDVDGSSEEIEKTVSTALAGTSSGVLTLQDAKGRRVVVPVDKLAYVEVAEAGKRTVGFGKH